jgi:hypothetical protein
MKKMQISMESKDVEINKLKDVIGSEKHKFVWNYFNLFMYRMLI